MHGLDGWTLGYSISTAIRPIYVLPDLQLAFTHHVGDWRDVIQVAEGCVGHGSHPKVRRQEGQHQVHNPGKHWFAIVYLSLQWVSGVQSVLN